MCYPDTDAEALDALYADQEGALAELLERLEAEAPALDALLADLEQNTPSLDALLAEAGAVCPCCGRPMEQPKASQTPTRSARPGRGQKRARRRA